MAGAGGEVSVQAGRTHLSRHGNPETGRNLLYEAGRCLSEAADLYMYSIGIYVCKARLGNPGRGRRVSVCGTQEVVS